MSWKRMARQDGGCGEQEPEEHGEVTYHMEAIRVANSLDPIDGANKKSANCFLLGDKP
jgi:hypothetical protein